MPVLGLILIFVWMAILVIATLLLHRKAGVPTFYTRKFLHIGTAFVWIIGKLVIGNTWHMFIPNTLCFLLIVASYFMKPIDGIENIEEGKRNYGTLYFAISTMLITACNFNSWIYPYAGLAFCSLAFGDGFAAIFGKLIKRKNPKLCGSKSVFGTVTCFLATLILAIIFNYWLKLGFSVLALLAIAGVSTIFELYTPFGLDNITIPLFVLALELGISVDVVPEAVLFVCAISPWFAIIALLKKVFTTVAAASAFVFLVAFAWFEGYSWVVNIFIGYAFILFTKVAHSVIKRKRDDENLESNKCRGFKQIISNLGFSLALTIAYYFIGFEPLRIGAYAAFACSICDSMASDIGVLQKGKPFDFCHLKFVNTGESGGVSVLGSSTAVIVAAINVAICVWIAKMPIYYSLIVGGAAIFGVVIDSVLGSLVQAKYECPICGKRIEYKKCCDTQAKLISGISFIDNNMVNVFSNGFAAIAGILFALIFI